jgi:hypothetical protein
MPSPIFVSSQQDAKQNTKALSFEEVNTLKGHNKKKNKKKQIQQKQ